ncbi:MAG: ABC transporter permease [Clostridiales bacterium]|jgi:oligopeptide transport system permease protein|nr:ABC transporter permease [Clostridiales bacterium]
MNTINGSGFRNYIIKRLAFAFLTFFLIVTLSFCIIRLMPGSVYDSADIPEAVLKLSEDRLLLDKPVLYQYAAYIKNVFIKWDFGMSLKVEPGVPAFDVLKRRIPVSLGINGLALLISLPLGALLGAAAALKRGKLTDRLITFNTVLLMSVPSFILASLLQYGAAFKLGVGDILYRPTGPFWARAASIALPVIALAIGPAALLARSLRDELTEAADADFILFAKAKGLGAFTVLKRHGLRFSVIPLVPLLTVMFTDILGGSLVVERIFAVGGAGGILVDSINARDYNLIMAVVIFYTGIELLALFAADLLLGVIDPRIRIGGEAR